MRKDSLARIATMMAVWLCCFYGAFAQGIPVTGKITNKDGQPLAGATITVKGSAVTTVTAEDGSFRITVPSEEATLVVSYIGFEEQQLKVGSKRSFPVTLVSVVASMDDVVVIGYGTRKKSDVTGAVASVGAEEIRKRPVANALQAMQGKVAGVDITSNERPGELGSILIRGVRSINATNSPLYVVDGIPLAAGGIEALNPNDIEAIDVLKDASATAIYGSRGANGVVMVTTKQGRKGKMQMSYIGTTTIENQHDRIDMMNSEQYIEFRRNAYRRLNSNPYPDEANYDYDEDIFGGDPYAWANVQKGWVDGKWNGSLVPTTDWMGMVLKTGFTQDHVLSVSGGTDKLKAYGSFGFLDQGGTVKGQDFRRYNARFNVEVKPVKWFTMGGSIGTTYSVQNYGYSSSSSSGSSNLYFAAQGMLPYAVPYDSNGNRINLPGGDVNILNPIGEDKYNINERKLLRALGSLYAEIELLKGVKYRVNFGPDFYNLRNGKWMDANSINRGGGEPGSTNYAQLNTTNRFSWTLDNLLYFDRTFDKHNIGVTLLQSASANRTETSSMTATNLPWDSQLWNQLSSVSELTDFSTGLSETQLTSYMARVNYGYEGKYLLTLSGRWDGASQLADGHKWDFFPSAALAWKMDQEDFMKNISWINELKLRIGYGSTGNAAVSAYTTKGGVTTLYYTWGSTVDAGYVSSDASLASPISMANLGLGWEHTSQVNLGVDFSLLKGRISGTLDLYTSKTTDLLLSKTISSLTGYTSTLANVGATSNKGIDFSLNTVNVKNRDFTWSSTLNFSATGERIVELANGKQDDITNRWFIGQRVGVVYDYEKIGVWQTSEQAEMDKFNANGNSFVAGDIKIKDLNGDNKIDANKDMHVLGHTNPNWSGGLTNTFNYKGWDLSVFLYARFGFMITTGNEFLQGRYAQRQLDYWTKNNPTNAYPAPDYSSAAGDTYASTLRYQNGSFVKIRNISVGYNFPKTILSKLTLTNMKVYAQLTNPGLIYSGVNFLDPDLGGSTFNRGVVFGVNVGL